MRLKDRGMEVPASHLTGLTTLSQADLAIRSLAVNGLTNGRQRNGTGSVLFEPQAPS